MTVAYPKKFAGFSARDIMTQVVRDRELHLVTLNRYRFSEQRSCQDLTEIIQRLDGQAPELIRDLSRHIADEARHAMWLTDLLVDLGANVGNPPGVSYIQEFERLLDRENQASNKSDDFLIDALAIINVTEKRGCDYFSAHIYALKQAPQTPENVQIRETLERILPEEAGHVSWGNRWLAELAKKSPDHARKVAKAKSKFAAIEQAAYEAGMDFTAGAELRRVSKLLDIAQTLPVWQQPQYLIERLPQSLLAPDLQFARMDIAQRAWQRDPKAFIEKFVPMFLQGFRKPEQKPQEKATA